MALVCNNSLYLTKTTSMAAALNNVTISCWVKVTTAPSVQARIFSAYRNGAASCALFVNSSRQIFAENGLATSTGSTVLALDTWYHIAMDGTGKVYINGSLELTLSSSGPFDGETTRFFGGDSVYPLTGKVAYARAWDGNLTSGQIGAEKDSTTAIITSGLLEDSSFISSTASGWTVNNGPASYDSDDPLASGTVVLDTPTFAEMNTTVTNDLGADGFTWPQCKPIVIDQYGKIVLITQRVNGGSKRHGFVVSNDTGATWTDPTLTSFFDSNGEGFLERGALAYDSANDLFHVLWVADDPNDGVIYRRYSPTRDGSNNITAFTRVSGVNLQLDFGATQYQHPSLIWTPDGGSNGSLLAVWGARNSGGATNKNEIRASMRVLSNTTGDNTAGNWAAPVSADTNGIGSAPQVAFSIIFQSNFGGIPYHAIMQKTVGSNAKDIYIGWHDGNSTASAKWQFRRMRWNSGSSNWSTGLSTTTDISNAVIAGTDTGYGLKNQLISQWTEDTVNNQMIIAFPIWKSNTDGDTVSFFRISSSDVVSSRVDVYSAGGSHSFAPTLDITFDNASENLVVGYLKTSTNDMWIKVYDATGTLVQVETALYTAQDCDIPLFYDGRFDGDKLFAVTRDHVASPYDGIAGTMTWLVGNDPPASGRAFQMLLMGMG